MRHASLLIITAMSVVFNDATDSIVIVRLCRPQLMSRASMLIITAMNCALGDAADSIVIVHSLWPQLMQGASFSHVLIQIKAKNSDSSKTP